jgi:hypothetical protein
MIAAAPRLGLGTLAALVVVLGVICPSSGRATGAATRAKPSHEATPKYVLLPEVTLSAKVRARVAQTANAYYRRTGKTLIVTSGTRDALDQARAMHRAFQLGADAERLYRNKAAARELLKIAEAGKAAKKSAAEIDAAIAAGIEQQMERGVYVSAHLRAGAVDVRSHGMTGPDKQAFLAGVAEAGGIEVIEEAAPPHFHLQLE